MLTADLPGSLSMSLLVLDEMQSRKCFTRNVSASRENSQQQQTAAGAYDLLASLN